MPTTLGYKDGWLCAIDEEAMSNEPTGYRNYFPLLRDRKQAWEEDFGKPLFYNRTSATYSLKIGGFWKALPLPQGGQTKPLYTETFPIPPPKRVRSETRWVCGHWEKRTAKGWQRA